MMLDKIRAFFSAAEAEAADDEAALHLAAAVLLVEVAKSDHKVQPAELERMEAVLRQNWALNEEDLADLVTVARDTSDAHASLHEHIDLINRNFTTEQKRDLVRGLWHVAYADEAIHHHEELLVRRLADLLHVPHRDFILTKHQAIEAQGRS